MGGRERPTVLVYGHYDVQPVEPLTAWATDPFRPVRDGPHLYARGASDDKGQLMAHLAAIEAWLATSARLPVNLRLILDGEEEIGSPTLVAAVAAGWRPLTADVALVSDTWMLAPDAPGPDYRAPRRAGSQPRGLRAAAEICTRERSAGPSPIQRRC